MPPTPSTQAPPRFSLDECKAMLPLVRAAADELTERRQQCRRLLHERETLESSQTPEGLTIALADLDQQIHDHEEGILKVHRELSSYGLSVLRLNPLVIHFPGRTRSGDIVFCWREGETTIAHGHPCGKEDEPACPLLLKEDER